MTTLADYYAELDNFQQQLERLLSTYPVHRPKVTNSCQTFLPVQDAETQTIPSSSLSQIKQASLVDELREARQRLFVREA